ncbi:MAG: hypothetical protein JO039_12855, partial [Solirubrobacterales bacterium]|nr:hypothetical protein [Solirubrobacterales bacterium]
GMAGGRFAVELAAVDAPQSFGMESVEFLVAGHAGSTPRPLGKVASGGELSRIALAVAVVGIEPRAGENAAPGTLVFDEVDAGIGGHTARAVGEHLRELSHGRQILCITHLPQVAALATRHFTIAKNASTVPATTSVTQLGGEAIIAELVRMLGAAEGDRVASRHARQLLKAA